MRPAAVSIQSPHSSIRLTKRAGERERDSEVINTYSTLLHSTDLIWNESLFAVRVTGFQ